MLRQSSELHRGDREVLLDLDLDHGPQAHTTDSYGSLQDNSFIPPRYLATITAEDDPCPHVEDRNKPNLPRTGNYFRDGKTKIGDSPSS
ncbi:unnamed protein product [Knipowitschia caucasica]